MLEVNIMIVPCYGVLWGGIFGAVVFHLASVDFYSNVHVYKLFNCVSGP